MEHPSELWMWGRETAIGTSLYWNINHKVLREGMWVSDTPYSCGTEGFARQEAAKMSEQRSSVDGRKLYRDVTVSGPHISWKEIYWKEQEHARK
jgi:hypothetical protein